MPRKANGESSIYQDANGTWHGKVSMGLKANGRRDRRHVQGPRRPAVVTKVRALEQQRDAGITTTAGRPPTVGQWLDHWLNTIAVRKVRPSTLEGYRSKINYRIKPALGHHRLDRLQPEHLDQFYDELQGSAGLSGTTALQIHRILSRALKVAMQRGRVSRNVCCLVDAPSAASFDMDPFDAHEARRLLDAAAGQRNSARWSVALALALRQGEALGLPWPAVDLDVGTLTVRQALQRQKGKGLVIVEPKSDAGNRTIALPSPLRDALRAHRAAQLAERMAAGPEWDDHGLVFTQPNGRPINPAGDWKAWKALLRTADLRDVRLHDARHTAATLLCQQGVPIRVVMEILGHSQVSLTMRYTHVLPDMMREAAAGMGEALWG